MASKEAVKKTEDEAPEEAAGEGEIDQAIDDLRGVLEQDAAGTAEIPDAHASRRRTIRWLPIFRRKPQRPMALVTPMRASLISPAATFRWTIFQTRQMPMKRHQWSQDTPDMNDLALNSMELPATTGASGTVANTDVIMDIPVEVQIVLGKSRMKVSSLMQLDEGATISLDRRIGESVDVMVNGRMIGRGEITVLENDETRFGVKLTEIIGATKPTGAA